MILHLCVIKNITRFIVMDIYTKRLVDEWKKHGKIVIAADFDGTISKWPPFENSEDIQKAIILLQEAYKIGAHIVIFTACMPPRFPEIEKYCNEKQIPITGININAIETPYGRSGKIYANIFLDDRAGFIETLTMLETAISIIRKEKY